MSMSTGQPAEIRSKYPHMLREDSAVWRKYLAGGPAAFSEVWYDVHVGTAVKVPAGSPDWMQRVSDGVTRKRIDVVARLTTWFWVIELKPVCGMAALGQAVTYQDLFEGEHADGDSVLPVVICNQVEADVRRTADRLGVLVIAVDGVLL